MDNEIKTGLKYLAYHVVSAVWWLWFAVLNYGILRSIGNEGGWEKAGQHAVVFGTLGVVVCTLLMLFRRSCRQKIAKYITSWKYTKWVILYAVLWIGALFYMHPEEHLIWETRSISQYLMEMVYILSYFGLFCSTIAFIAIGVITCGIMLFTDRSERE